MTTRFAGALTERFGDLFPFRCGLAHLIKEAAHFSSKFRPVLGEEHVAGGAPPAIDYFARLEQL